MEIFEKFLKFINEFNLKFTKYKYRKYLKTSIKSGEVKSLESADYSAKFSCIFEDRKKEVEKKVENIVKKAKNNPYKLIGYVEKHGTNVYKIKNADKILALINETEGFITPKKGIKALYLNLIINKKFSFKFRECFIIRDLALDPYCMIHQFYTWYAFKSGFAGYEYETQEKFNNLINSKDKKEKIDNFSISDILALKEAIHRDIEAIDFVIKLAKNSDGAKAAFQKMLSRVENVNI